MSMVRPRFLSQSDRGELLACVKRQRENHGVARRANALLLLDEGKSCALIADFFIWTTTRCAAGTSSIWPRAGRAGNCA